MWICQCQLKITVHLDKFSLEVPRLAELLRATLCPDFSAEQVVAAAGRASAALSARVRALCGLEACQRLPPHQGRWWGSMLI